MRRCFTFALIPACFATLFLACYAPALFGDRQFGYRDSAHYYYPLHRRVQQEWDAGRWPLWEPEENAGMPLLGNPTAAVLYPGKVVFAALPYAWAARVYVVMHTALAFAAMLVLMRSWRTSRVGSALAASSYAFGAPIVFQYSNVVYLVGAAWLPLGFCASDRWIRLGRRGGLVGLAIVLAMQVLGGDPESAYLLGWAAIGYAAGIARGRARAARRAARASGERPSAGLGRRRAVALAIIVPSLWLATTLAMATWLPRLRPSGYPPPPLPWMAWVPRAVTAAWGLAGLAFLASWHRRGRRSPLGVAWLGLVLSAGLAMAIAAAQLLPVLEFLRQTARAVGAGPHDLYPFSIEPIRMAELAWPNVLGLELGGNTYWRDALKLPGPRPEIWAPSLYLGGLTLVLACGSLAIRQGSAPWRIWLAVVAAVGLAGSQGQYTSPIWAVRALSEVAGWPPLRDLARQLGPLDPLHSPAVRLDRALRDGDGSFYWWLAQVLPGFRQFRYPAKLFTFTALGMAALAGVGWDDLRTSRAGRFTLLFTLVLVTSLVGLAGVWIARPAILAAFRRPVTPNMFGPLDAGGAFRMLAASMAQAAIVAGLGLATVGLGRTRPRAAGAIALVVSTADLAMVDARLIVTVPQAAFESRPEALRIIADHEREHPATGPFRIERMPAWHPSRWTTTPSAERATDMVRWERDTLQDKYGIVLGIEYTHTFGVGQLYEYDWFFDGVPRAVRTPAMADRLGIPPGTEIVYFPRRSYDLWNTRYFIIPSYPHGWRDPWRGYASFLVRTEPIHPPPGDAEALRRSREQDWQIRRNRDELPRAWVVHDARWLEPSEGRSMEARNRALLPMLYADDPIWHDPTMRASDPRAVAWVDLDLKPELDPYLSGRPTRPTETVTVSYPTPQRAELEVALESAGLVILSDLHYPGWELTIDGRPAPIYRVNRLMRGAAVPPGRHHLVYSYEPRSFRLGRMISILGLCGLALLAFAGIRQPVDADVRPDPEPP